MSNIHPLGPPVPVTAGGPSPPVPPTPVPVTGGGSTTTALATTSANTIWWVLGGLGVLAVGIIAYLALKSGPAKVDEYIEPNPRRRRRRRRRSMR